MKRLDKNGQKRGLYLKSEIHRKKISRSLIGSTHSVTKHTAKKISKSLKLSVKHKIHSQQMTGVPRSLETRRKISETRKLRGLKPRPTPVAMKLYKALGKGWLLEHRISFGKGGGSGNFPFDIVNPTLRIIIECDGKSHEHLKQKIKDRIIQDKFEKLGWKIIRVNEKWL